VSNSTTELNDLLRRAFDVLDGAHKARISTTDLAGTVYAEIDPYGTSPEMVRWAAMLMLRKMAGAMCRLRSLLDSAIAESGNSFYFHLQPRYPVKDDAEMEYVLRECLTYAERMANIERLRHEAATKRLHADALQSETDALVRARKLVAEVLA